MGKLIRECIYNASLGAATKIIGEAGKLVGSSKVIASQTGNAILENVTGKFTFARKMVEAVSDGSLTWKEVAAALPSLIKIGRPSSSASATSGAGTATIRSSRSSGSTTTSPGSLTVDVDVDVDNDVKPLFDKIDEVMKVLKPGEKIPEATQLQIKELISILREKELS